MTIFVKQKDKEYSEEDLELLFEEIRSGERCFIIKNRTFIFKYPDKKVITEVSRTEKLLRDQYKDTIPDIGKVTLFILGEEITDSDGFLEKEKHKLELVLDHDEIKTNAESYKIYKEKYRIICEKLEKIKNIELRKSNADLYSLGQRIKSIIFQKLISRQTYVAREDNEFRFFDRIPTSRAIYWYRELLDEFLDFYYGPKDNILRRLARTTRVSNLWRVSCSTGSPFFEGPTTTYTPVQNKLCFWLSYYTDIFKNIGSPDSDETYHNDELFDRWVRDKVNELKQRSSENSSGRTGNTKGTNRHKIAFKKPTRASAKTLGKGTE